MALPLLLDHYAPDMERVPAFLMRLALDVDYSQEKPCLRWGTAACMAPESHLFSWLRLHGTLA